MLPSFHSTINIDNTMNLSTTQPTYLPLFYLTAKLSILILAGVQNTIDQSVLHGLGGAHEVIPIQILGNLFRGLSGHHAVHLNDVVADAHNLSRLDLDVLGLTLRSAHGLVDHYPRGWEGQTLALAPCREDEGTHGGCEAKVDGNYLRGDVLHAVVDGKTTDDRTAGTVDVEVDGFVGVLGVEVEHDADYLVGQLVVDFGSDEDDPLAVQPVVDVHPFGTLRAGGAVGYLGNANGHHGYVVAVRTGG
mmetsp:Transcript_26009/g.57811  ORF Transcript_26009/g.57811 Transcript_26009/m.57811 type:complete len:247 (-) Transcript_26009:211-951(-)